MKTLLHVGCGHQNKSSLKGFSSPDWQEIRFDIDPSVRPDIIGSLTDMANIDSGGVDALFSSHNVEHLYPHEVPIALKEFARVLRTDGFAVITCPDLQAVAAHVAEGRLTEPLYVSPSGPIAPLDIMFGYTAAMAAGNIFMAHHTGFTQETLQHALQNAGFRSVFSLRDPQNFSLWCVAWKNEITETDALRLASGFIPVMPDVRSLVNDGRKLNDQGRYTEALAVLDEALKIDPTNLLALHSQAFSFLSLNRFAECLARCDEALALRPNWLNAMLDRAYALARLGRNREALEGYDAILALEPDHDLSLDNSATLLRNMGRHAEAKSRLKRVIERDRATPWALGSLLTAQLGVFDWNGLDELYADIRKGIAAGLPVAEPLCLMPVCDDPQIMLDAARICAGSSDTPLSGTPEDNAPLSGFSKAFPRHRRGEKIRIGYFSSDFRNHIVFDLIAEVLERHDRNHFEVHAFSYSAEDAPTQVRVRAIVDHFHDVSNLRPREIVELALAQNLDIAIDLNGHTSGARPVVFATRIAPVQISWLGYPGTTGAPYMDYILADETVIPTEYRRFYSEKLLALPHCFQPNDSRRDDSSWKLTRAEYGLPEQGFVYCCFNNPAKVSPQILDIWASILKAVDRSVLWIYGGKPEEGRQNFLREVSARGIDAKRIVFAGWESGTRHLARHKLADLFLDTSPFNAGATAASAIWAGLPMLTFPGATFSSRYGASILKAAGLEELIAADQAAYQELAIELGRNPLRIKALKKKLAANRHTTPLFDIPRFVAGLEEAYRRVVERNGKGLAPDHIVVADEDVGGKPVPAE